MVIFHSYVSLPEGRSTDGLLPGHLIRFFLPGGRLRRRAQRCLCSIVQPAELRHFSGGQNGCGGRGCLGGHGWLIFAASFVDKWVVITYDFIIFIAYNLIAFYKPVVFGDIIHLSTTSIKKTMAHRQWLTQCQEGCSISATVNERMAMKNPWFLRELILDSI